jgi:hypothetical protein
MDFQLAATIILITLAIGYLFVAGYKGWMRMRGGRCGSGCGCGITKERGDSRVISSAELSARLSQRPKD